MTDKATSMTRIEHAEDAPKVCQDAFNAGDLDGLVNLFEPEAMILLAPNQLATGSAEIRQVSAHLLAT